ncbi:MAG: PqqD family protein [Dehalococcoidia bacterium]|nr:PqqD family protein [Dehalococcoidia bacterium]
MKTAVTLRSICQPSEDVVAREIEGEIIIVPLVAGIGDADDELYTLNETGRAIWQTLDGQKSLGQVAENLSAKFVSEPKEIENDVLGFAAEMVHRGILVVRS